MSRRRGNSADRHAVTTIALLCRLPRASLGKSVWVACGVMKGRLLRNCTRCIETTGELSRQTCSHNHSTVSLTPPRELRLGMSVWVACGGDERKTLVQLNSLCREEVSVGLGELTLRHAATKLERVRVQYYQRQRGVYLYSLHPKNQHNNNQDARVFPTENLI